MTLSKVPAQLVRPQRAVQRATLDDVMTYTPTWRTEREALRDFMPVRFGLGSRVGLGVRAGCPRTWVPPDIGGLRAWYRARDVTKDGSNRVSASTNQVVPQPNLVQAAGGRQPLWQASDAELNGQQSMLLDAARGDKLHSTTFAAPFTVPTTWFAVGHLRTYNAAVNSCVMAQDISGGGDGPNIYFDKTSGTIRAWSGTALVGPVVAADTAFVVVAVLNGASSKLYFSALTPTTGTTGSTAVGDQFIIGSHPAFDGAWPFDGSIVEAGMFDGALSQANAELILNWGGALAGVSIGA